MVLHNGIMYLIIAALSFVSLIIYFRVAKAFKIVDKPNQRSSHIEPTIRGGGIVFVVALLLWFVGIDFCYPYFITGCVLIATISFIDDIREQSPLSRLGIQLISFLLVALQLDLFQYSFWVFAIMAVITLGVINVFNFMDGINGLTGMYAIVNLVTFFFINHFIVPFTGEELIGVMIMTVLIFLFFNFRKKARCFAGDVGSITIAFLLIFLMLQLTIKTSSYVWLLMFLLYGVDSVVTILYRLRRKENILKPHRCHLYQYLSNEMKFSHLVVSTVYGIVQLFINVVLVLFFIEAPVWYFWFFVLVGVLLYVAIREWVLKQVDVKGLFERSK